MGFYFKKRISLTIISACPVAVTFLLLSLNLGKQKILDKNNDLAPSTKYKLMSAVDGRKSCDRIGKYKFINTSIEVVEDQRLCKSNNLKATIVKLKSQMKHNQALKKLALKKHTIINANAKIQQLQIQPNSTSKLNDIYQIYGRKDIKINKSSLTKKINFNRNLNIQINTHSLIIQNSLKHKKIPIQIQTTSDHSGFVVSDNRLINGKKQNRMYLRYRKLIEVPIVGEGDYYFKIQLIGKDQTISDWSNEIKVSVISEIKKQLQKSTDQSPIHLTRDQSTTHQINELETTQVDVKNIPTTNNLSQLEQPTELKKNTTNVDLIVCQTQTDNFDPLKKIQSLTEFWQNKCLIQNKNSTERLPSSENSLINFKAIPADTEMENNTVFSKIETKEIEVEDIDEQEVELPQKVTETQLPVDNIQSESFSNSVMINNTNDQKNSDALLLTNSKTESIIKQQNELIQLLQLKLEQYKNQTPTIDPEVNSVKGLGLSKRKNNGSETKVTNIGNERAGTSTIYLGLGFNYMQYNESFPDLETSYNEFTSPIYHFGGYMSIDEEDGIDYSYRSLPLHFDNSAVGKLNLTGSWNSFVAHYSSRQMKSDNHIWDTIFGIQIHQTPVPLFRDSDNQSLAINLNLFNFSLGKRYYRYFNLKTRFIMELHWQYPLAYSVSRSQNQIHIKPKLLFDGSLGLEKHLNETQWYGLYWYGQYLNLNFDYSDPEVTASGTHETFFTTFELRFTQEF